MKCMFCVKLKLADPSYREIEHSLSNNMVYKLIEYENKTICHNISNYMTIKFNDTGAGEPLVFVVVVFFSVFLCLKNEQVVVKTILKNRS